MGMPRVAGWFLLGIALAMSISIVAAIMMQAGTASFEQAAGPIFVGLVIVCSTSWLMRRLLSHSPLILFHSFSRPPQPHKLFTPYYDQR